MTFESNAELRNTIYASSLSQKVELRDIEGKVLWLVNAEEVNAFIKGTSLL